MNLENNPLKRLKEKKGEIHTPTVKAFDGAELKEVQQVSKSSEPPRRTEASKGKKQSKEKHTFVISKDLLFTLQALSNYKDITINSILETSLNNYFKNQNTEELNKAKDIYKQILQLKSKKYE